MKKFMSVKWSHLRWLGFNFECPGELIYFCFIVTIGSWLMASTEDNDIFSSVWESAHKAFLVVDKTV